MSTKQTEALKLAQDLRALADRFSEGWHEGIKIDASDIVLLSDAAEALAEQPAQPIKQGWDVDTLLNKPKQPAQQQEPVAWKYKVEPAFDGEKWHDCFDLTESKSLALWKDKYAQPLYTSPPASKPWVGLTPEERQLIKQTNTSVGCFELNYNIDAILDEADAKLREKNA